MADPRCCEFIRLVYDCEGPCRRREYRELTGTYLAEIACGECHEDTPRRPDTFPSTMNLVGLWCPVHGWQPAPHLRQAALFR